MDRSIHITYDTQDHEKRYAIRDAIIRLIEHARRLDAKEKAHFRILDCGCGMGLFMRDLKSMGYEKTEGMDLDPNCVENAKKFGTCQQASFKDIDELFEKEQFDLVILSHVLEHMKYPTDVLTKIQKISKWIVIAVPNPLRPKIQVKYSIRGKDYSNKGHYHSWDRSHFTNFLTHFNDLFIEKWEVDRVRIIPHRYLRKPMKKIGLLDFLETRLIPRILPYYSDSLIALSQTK